MSEFKEKSDLINELLSRMDLNFEPNMTRKEREALDVERQTFVLRAGWNKLSIAELKALLAPEPAGEEEKMKEIEAKMDERTIEMKVVKVNQESWPDSEIRVERIVIKKVVNDLLRAFYDNGIPPPPEEELIKLVEGAVDGQNRCSDKVAIFIGMKKA